MNDSDKGLELWEHLAGVINSQPLIEKNNKAIWGLLHKWSNHEWLAVLNVVADLQDSHPEYFHAFQNKALAEAARVIVNEGSTHPRVLDTREHKNKMWRMAMCLREIWNKMQQDLARPRLFEHA